MKTESEAQKITMLIVQFRQEGESYASIARRFYMTAGRVKRIVTRNADAALKEASR